MGVQPMKVVVLDFDGTLYKNNSFPCWIRYCLRRSLVEWEFAIFMRIFFSLLLRKLIGIYTHSKFKEKINSIDYPKGWSDDFCESLVFDYNEGVVSRIKSISDYYLILSTAAPFCYAQKIRSDPSIKIDHIISSNSKDGLFFDNQGLMKRDITMEFIRDSGFSGISVLFLTDHHSDVYFAKESNEVVLCNPNDKALCTFLSEGVDFSVLRSK